MLMSVKQSILQAAKIDMDTVHAHRLPKNIGTRYNNGPILSLYIAYLVF